MDWHIVRASIRLVSATLHIPRLFLAIIAISFFWAMGAVLAAQFPPLVKNALGADQTGRDPVPRHLLDRGRDRLGRGQPAAQRPGVGALSRRPRRCCMGLFVLDLLPPGQRLAGGRRPSCATSPTFLAMPDSWMIVLDLLGVAIAGGMFVVPLYAFLTTTVPKSETARTIAANNIVNSGLMVAATLILTGRGACWGDGRRQPADRRRRQRRRRLARLEAPPRLRLSASGRSGQIDRHEQEAGRRRSSRTAADRRPAPAAGASAHREGERLAPAEAERSGCGWRRGEREHGKP